MWTEVGLFCRGVRFEQVENKKKVIFFLLAGGDALFFLIVWRLCFPSLFSLLFFSRPLHPLTTKFPSSCTSCRESFLKIEKKKREEGTCQLCEHWF